MKGQETLRSMEKTLQEKRVEIANIGKRVECSEEKLKFLNEIAEGRAFFYHVYLYRFYETKELLRVLEAVSDVYGQYPFLRTYYSLNSKEISGLEVFSKKIGASVHDLSTLGQKEKISARTRMISFEKRKIYDPMKNSMLRVRILRMDDTDYIMILALCEEQEVVYFKNKILSLIFQNYRIESVWQLQDFDWMKQSPTFSNINFWKGMLEGYRGFQSTSQSYKQNLRETEVYELQPEIVNDIDVAREKYHLDQRIFYFLGLGILLYQLTGKNDICLGEVRENNQMDIMPIRFTMEHDLMKMVKQIGERLEQMNQHKNCVRSGVEKLMKISMEQLIPIQIAFEQDQDMEKILYAMKPGVPYEITAKEGGNCPMFISISGSKKSKVQIQYNYNSALFEQVMMVDFHSSLEQIFRVIFEDLLKGEEDTKEHQPKKYDIPIKHSSKGKIVHTIIGETLQKTGIFDGCSKEELMQAGGRCKMRNYVSGDLLVEEKSPVDHLYFVAEGTISMEKLNMEQVMMPVRMLFQGDVFGTEVLRKNRTAAYSYSVYSESARIVEMPISVFYELVAQKIQILPGLFQILGEREDQLAMLWMLE